MMIHSESSSERVKDIKYKIAAEGGGWQRVAALESVVAGGMRERLVDTGGMLA